MVCVLPSRFTYIGHLGKGSFGTCLKVHDEHLGKHVALKILNPSLKNEPFNASILREIKIMTLIKDSGFQALTNIIRLEEALVSDDNSEIYLVEELMDTDLMQFLDDYHDKLSFSDKLYIFQQVINGLLVLHKFNIIHRDLKPHNILINKRSLQVKIADFGLSRYYHSCLPNVNYPIETFPVEQDSAIFRQLQENVVTLPYRAPELLMYPNYSWRLITKKIDSWSLGLIAMHIFYHGKLIDYETSLTFPDLAKKPDDMDDGFYVINHWCQTFGLSPIKHPFLFELMDQDARLENEKQFMQNNYKESRFDSFIKQSLGNEANSLGHLIKQLLNLDPTKRISVENLIMHPYIYYNSYNCPHRRSSTNTYQFKFSFTATKIYESDVDFDHCDDYFAFEDIDHENSENKIFDALLNSCFKISSGQPRYLTPLSTTSTFTKEYRGSPQKIQSLLNINSEFDKNTQYSDCQRVYYSESERVTKIEDEYDFKSKHFAFEEINCDERKYNIVKNDLFDRVSLNSSKSSIHHSYSYMEK